MKFKTLILEQIDAIEAEIKMMLHASRDCYRNRKENAITFRFNISDAYYAEGYGIMRGLKVLGYGIFGAVNIPEERTNLSWWFDELQCQVLKEENFGGNGECDYCVQKFGKDDAGRTRECLTIS